MSVEGGIVGTQKSFLCGKCGKTFFAWRPDTDPGQKIKCYFCKNEIEDDAAKRPREIAPPAQPLAPAPAPVAPKPDEQAATDDRLDRIESRMAEEFGEIKAMIRN